MRTTEGEGKQQSKFWKRPNWKVDRKAYLPPKRGKNILADSYVNLSTGRVEIHKDPKNIPSNLVSMQTAKTYFFNPQTGVLSAKKESDGFIPLLEAIGYGTREHPIDERPIKAPGEVPWEVSQHFQAEPGSKLVQGSVPGQAMFVDEGGNLTTNPTGVPIWLVTANGETSFTTTWVAGAQPVIFGEWIQSQFGDVTGEQAIPELEFRRGDIGKRMYWNMVTNAWTPDPDLGIPMYIDQEGTPTWQVTDTPAFMTESIFDGFQALRSDLSGKKSVLMAEKNSKLILPVLASSVKNGDFLYYDPNTNKIVSGDSDISEEVVEANPTWVTHGKANKVPIFKLVAADGTVTYVLGARDGGSHATMDENLSAAMSGSYTNTPVDLSRIGVTDPSSVQDTPLNQTIFVSRDGVMVPVSIKEKRTSLLEWWSSFSEKTRSSFGAGMRYDKSDKGKNTIAGRLGIYPKDFSMRLTWAATTLPALISYNVLMAGTALEIFSTMGEQEESTKLANNYLLMASKYPGEVHLIDENGKPYTTTWKAEAEKLQASNKELTAKFEADRKAKIKSLYGQGASRFVQFVRTLMSGDPDSPENKAMFGDPELDPIQEQTRLEVTGQDLLTNPLVLKAGTASSHQDAYLTFSEANAATSDAEMIRLRQDAINQLVLVYKRERYSGGVDATFQYSWIGNPELYEEYLQAIAQVELQRGAPLSDYAKITLASYFADPVTELAGTAIYDPLNLLDLIPVDLAISGIAVAAKVRSAAKVATLMAKDASLTEDAARALIKAKKLVDVSKYSNRGLSISDSIGEFLVQDVIGRGLKVVGRTLAESKVGKRLAESISKYAMVKITKVLGSKSIRSQSMKLYQQVYRIGMWAAEHASDADADRTFVNLMRGLGEFATKISNATSVQEQLRLAAEFEKVFGGGKIRFVAAISDGNMLETIQKMGAIVKSEGKDWDVLARTASHAAYADSYKSELVRLQAKNRRAAGRGGIRWWNITPEERNAFRIARENAKGNPAELNRIAKRYADLQKEIADGAALIDNQAKTFAIKKSSNKNILAHYLGEEFRKTFYQGQSAWETTRLTTDSFLGMVGKYLGKPSGKLRGLIEKWEKGHARALIQTFTINWIQAILGRRPAWVIRNWTETTLRYLFCGTGPMDGVGELFSHLKSEMDGGTFAEMNLFLYGSDPNINVPTRVLEDPTLATPFGFRKAWNNRIKAKMDVFLAENADAVPKASRRAFTKTWWQDAFNGLRFGLSEWTDAWQDTNKAVEFAMRLRTFNRLYLRNISRASDIVLPKLKLALIARLVEKGIAQDEVDNVVQLMEEAWSRAKHDPTRLSVYLNLSEMAKGDDVISWWIPERTYSSSIGVDIEDRNSFLASVKVALDGYMKHLTEAGKKIGPDEVDGFFRQVEAQVVDEMRLTSRGYFKQIAKKIAESAGTLDEVSVVEDEVVHLINNPPPKMTEDIARTLEENGVEVTKGMTPKEGADLLDEKLPNRVTTGELEDKYKEIVKDADWYKALTPAEQKRLAQEYAWQIARDDVMKRHLAYAIQGEKRAKVHAQLHQLVLEKFGDSSRQAVYMNNHAMNAERMAKLYRDFLYNVFPGWLLYSGPERSVAWEAAATMHSFADQTLTNLLIDVQKDILDNAMSRPMMTIREFLDQVGIDLKWKDNKIVRMEIVTHRGKAPDVFGEGNKVIDQLQTMFGLSSESALDDIVKTYGDTLAKATAQRAKQIAGLAPEVSVTSVEGLGTRPFVGTTKAGFVVNPPVFPEMDEILKKVETRPVDWKLLGINPKNAEEGKRASQIIGMADYINQELWGKAPGKVTKIYQKALVGQINKYLFRYGEDSYGEIGQIALDDAYQALKRRYNLAHNIDLRTIQKEFLGTVSQAFQLQYHMTASQSKDVVTLFENVFSGIAKTFDTGPEEIWKEIVVAMGNLDDDLLKTCKHFTNPDRVLGLTDWTKTMEAVLLSGSKADLRTALHEMFHALTVPAKAGDFSGPMRWLPETYSSRMYEWASGIAFKRLSVGGNIPKIAEIRKESSEVLALAWEVYIKEGKAPSKDLKNIFRTLGNALNKTWKVLDPEELKEYAHIELNEEIRKVFDELFNRSFVEDTVAKEIGFKTSGLIDPNVTRGPPVDDIPMFKYERSPYPMKAAVDSGDLDPDVATYFQKTFIDRNPMFINGSSAHTKTRLFEEIVANTTASFQRMIKAELLHGPDVMAMPREPAGAFASYRMSNKSLAEVLGVNIEGIQGGIQRGYFETGAGSLQHEFTHYILKHEAQFGQHPELWDSLDAIIAPYIDGATKYIEDLLASPDLKGDFAGSQVAALARILDSIDKNTATDFLYFQEILYKIDLQPETLTDLIPAEIVNQYGFGRKTVSGVKDNVFIHDAIVESLYRKYSGKKFIQYYPGGLTQAEFVSYDKFLSSGGEEMALRLLDSDIHVLDSFYETIADSLLDSAPDINFGVLSGNPLIKDATQRHGEKLLSYYQSQHNNTWYLVRPVFASSSRKHLGQETYEKIIQQIGKLFPDVTFYRGEGVFAIPSDVMDKQALTNMIRDGISMSLPDVGMQKLDVTYYAVDDWKRIGAGIANLKQQEVFAASGRLANWYEKHGEDSPAIWNSLNAVLEDPASRVVLDNPMQSSLMFEGPSFKQTYEPHPGRAVYGEYPIDETEIAELRKDPWRYHPFSLSIEDATKLGDEIEHTMFPAKHSAPGAWLDEFVEDSEMAVWHKGMGEGRIFRTFHIAEDYDPIEVGMLRNLGARIKAARGVGSPDIVFVLDNMKVSAFAKYIEKTTSNPLNPTLMDSFKEFPLQELFPTTTFKERTGSWWRMKINDTVDSLPDTFTRKELEKAMAINHINREEQTWSLVGDFLSDKESQAIINKDDLVAAIHPVTLRTEQNPGWLDYSTDIPGEDSFTTRLVWEPDDNRIPSTVENFMPFSGGHFNDETIVWARGNTVGLYVQRDAEGNIVKILNRDVANSQNYTGPDILEEKGWDSADVMNFQEGQSDLEQGNARAEKAIKARKQTIDDLAKRLELKTEEKYTNQFLSRYNNDNTHLVFSPTNSNDIDDPWLDLYISERSSLYRTNRIYFELDGQLPEHEGKTFLLGGKDHPETVEYYRKEFPWWLTNIQGYDVELDKMDIVSKNRRLLISGTVNMPQSADGMVLKEHGKDIMDMFQEKFGALIFGDKFNTKHTEAIVSIIDPTGEFPKPLRLSPNSLDEVKTFGLDAKRDYLAQFWYDEIHKGESSTIYPHPWQGESGWTKLGWKNALTTAIDRGQKYILWNSGDTQWRVWSAPQVDVTDIHIMADGSKQYDLVIHTIGNKDLVVTNYADGAEVFNISKYNDAFWAKIHAGKLNPGDNFRPNFAALEATYKNAFPKEARKLTQELGLKDKITELTMEVPERLKVAWADDVSTYYLYEIDDETVSKLRDINTGGVPAFKKTFTDATQDKIDTLWKTYTLMPRFQAGENAYGIQDIIRYLFKNEDIMGSPTSYLTAIRKHIAQLEGSTKNADLVESLKELLREGEYMEKYLTSIASGEYNVVPPISMWQYNQELRGWITTRQYLSGEYGRAVSALGDWRDDLKGALIGDPLWAKQQPKPVVDALNEFSTEASKAKSQVVKSALYGGDIDGDTFMGAIPETNRAMLDYSDTTTLDEQMKGLMPFWMFPTRSIPFWLETYGKHPELLAFYAKYLEFGKKQALQSGATNSKGEVLPSLVGYVRIPGTDIWINPMSALMFQTLFPIRRYDYNDEEGGITPVQKVASYLYDEAMLHGFSLSPIAYFALQPLLPTDYPKPGPAYEVARSVFPIELTPPWMERWILSTLRKIDNKIPETWTPRVSWQDYLIERQILQESLKTMGTTDDIKMKYTIAGAAATVIKDPDRESNPAWIEARAQIENSQYWANMSSYFTSIYPKPLSPGYIELYQLRNEINLMRDVINSQVKGTLFSPFVNQTEREEAYRTRRYETPEGWIWNQYQAVSWVTDPETGQPVTGNERRELIAQTYLEDEQTNAYYDSLGVLYDELNQRLMSLPIGAPWDMESGIWEWYTEERTKIEESPMYDMARRSWSVGYKSNQALTEHFTTYWWQLVNETRPQMNTTENYTDYKIRLDSWEKALPDMARVMMPVFVANLSQYYGDLKTDQDLSGLVGDIMKETNAEGYLNYQMTKDSEYDALNRAYDALYMDVYWAAVDKKSGVERQYAEYLFKQAHPTPPTSIELIAWILGNYTSGQFDVVELQAAVSGRDALDLDKLQTAGKDPEELKIEEVWNYLSWAGIGNSYTEFTKVYEEMGGDPDALVLFYGVRENPSVAWTNPEEFDAFYNAVLKAAAKLDLQPPTGPELEAMVLARQLNDNFKKLVYENIGQDFYDILGQYARLSSYDKRKWKTEHFQDYRNIQYYYQLKDWYAKEYPDWALFYYTR